MSDARAQAPKLTASGEPTRAAGDRVSYPPGTHPALDYYNRAEHLMKRYCATQDLEYLHAARLALHQGRQAEGLAE